MNAHRNPNFGRTERLWPLVALCVLLTAAARAQTSQTQLQIDTNLFSNAVENYNLLSLSSASFNSYGDTQGGLAVNGDLTLNGGSVASQASNFNPNSNPTLYVTGQLSLTGGTTYLAQGYAATPGLSTGSYAWNASQKTLTGGGGVLSSINSNSANAGSSPIVNPAPANWNWSTLTSNLANASSDFASAAATGTIGVSGQNLTFTGPAGQTSGVVVFNLDASLISGNTYNGQTISSVSVSVPTGVDYVINVLNAGGQSLFGSGVNFNAGTNDSQLLWNFEGAGNVTLAAGGDFYGAILAPSASVTADMIITGQVAADGFTDNNYELHDADFIPTAITTPEPVCYALSGAGLCALGIGWQRWRRRAAA